MARSTDIQAWLEEQLEIAKQEPGADILTSIGRGVDSGAFDLREGIVILQTLLAAGGESTTSLMGNSVRMLAERPDLQQDLRDNPERIPAFVEEALRLESPFRSMPRSVKHDTTLGGVVIPAGATVLLMFAAGNRDAAAFEDPDEIVLERPRRHLTFGSGIHMCVGNPLARLEGRVMLSALLKRTSSFALDPNDQPEWVNSLQVRRHERLSLKVVPS